MLNTKFIILKQNSSFLSGSDLQRICVVVQHRSVVRPQGRAVLPRVITGGFHDDRPAGGYPWLGVTDHDPGLLAQLVAVVRSVVGEEVRPAGAHWAAILTGKTETNHAVSVVAIVRLASLAWDVVAFLLYNQHSLASNRRFS